MKRTVRTTIRFEEWMPVAADYAIGYSYIDPATGRTHRTGTDRWMRAKAHIAASAIATGASLFDVHGGVGTRRWTRIVSVSQEEADSFFRGCLDAGDFMLRGAYDRARLARQRRAPRW